VVETNKRAGREAWFDIVILGGGSAGCVLAARLSADADTRGHRQLNLNRNGFGQFEVASALTKVSFDPALPSLSQ
jgi:hypothetical protein